MRKGNCTANARLIFFEKELLYCKLTVASGIQKGLLHVSFGAVGSWSFAALNRGLQNLGTSCERNVVRTFRVYEKYQKYIRGLRTSGLRGRFKALPEIILQSFPAAHAETGFACKTAVKRL